MGICNYWTREAENGYSPKWWVVIRGHWPADILLATTMWLVKDSTDTSFYGVQTVALKWFTCIIFTKHLAISTHIRVTIFDITKSDLAAIFLPYLLHYFAMIHKPRWTYNALCQSNLNAHESMFRKMMSLTESVHYAMLHNHIFPSFLSLFVAEIWSWWVKNQ